MHTTASDGRNSVAEMARAAEALGLEYICITDHSRSLTVAQGLSRERLLAQIDEIEAFNREGACPVHVLAGLEVDILDEGALDMDDDVLDRLDWVVGSIHQKMNQPADVITRRLLGAIRSGRISAIGHPTGRLIGVRDGYDFDFQAVLDACAEHGVALEINASAERLDLRAESVRRVMEDGRVALTINTDAHGTDSLARRVLGVRTARRGWATPERVVNTWPLERVRARFGRGRASAAGDR
jgi:DNA polymerase (family 10)